jgi:hypothetical protein
MAADHFLRIKVMGGICARREPRDWFSIEEGPGSGLNLDKYRELFQKGAGGRERRRSHTQLP